MGGIYLFIQISNDHKIRSRDIVTIIEYDVLSSSTIMNEMIEHKQTLGHVIGSVAEAKSIIITDQNIYYSSLAIPTLKKRSSIGSMLSRTKEYVDELDID